MSLKFEGLPWQPQLRLCISTARGAGSMPGWGTKILHATWLEKKIFKLIHIDFVYLCSVKLLKMNITMQRYLSW